MRAPFRIGLLGLGNVGGALARRLVDDADRVTAAAGRPIRLEAIGVRNRNGRQAAARLVGPDELLETPGLDAVVELIGGLEPAHTYIKAALGAGREVVTANKQLIAAHGPALARLGPIRFEASVASAIPVVELLAESLAADRIDSVIGILNGTTNFMLGEMSGGASYEEALREAQRRGMAEADPTADVDGHDAAAKLAILMMLAFRKRIEVNTIERVGIRKATAGDRKNGLVKLIAAARATEDGAIAADVRPRLVPAEAALARTDGALNAIELRARYAGTLLLTGPGAGPDAAASAVIADLVRAARGVPASAGALLGSLADEPAVRIEPIGARAPFAAA